MATGDKARHKMEETKGQAKERLGEATGSEQRQAEGRIEQAKGSLKQAGEKIKEAARGTTKKTRRRT